MELLSARHWSRRHYPKGSLVRRLLALGIVMASVALACSPGAGPAAPGPAGREDLGDELTVAAWGGSIEDAMRKILIPEFEKKFGVKVVYVPGISKETVAKVKAQGERPQISVAMTDEDIMMISHQEGLVEPFDPARVTNSADVYPIAKMPENIGVMFGFAGAGLFYNTKVFAEKGWDPPTSWMDLWDPKYKGHATIHHINNGTGLRFFMIVNRIQGGDFENVTPALTKIEELLPNLLTIDVQNQTPQLVQQGEAWIGTWARNNINIMQDSGVPVEFVAPKEGTFSAGSTAWVVKNGPNQDLANEWLNMLLDPEMQRRIVFEAIGTTPMNSKVELSEQEQERVFYGEDIDRLIPADWIKVNQLRPGWTDQFDRTIGQ